MYLLFVVYWWIWLSCWNHVGKVVSFSVVLSKSLFSNQVYEWLEPYIKTNQLSITSIQQPILPKTTTTTHHDDYPYKDEVWELTNVQNPRYSILLHLLPTPTTLKTIYPSHHSQQQQQLGRKDNNNNNEEKKTKRMIHLHQDVWIRKQDIVQCRLLHQLNIIIKHNNDNNNNQQRQQSLKNKTRIYARKTIVKRINATLATTFLQQHHLWGSPTRSAKYYYGLFIPSSNNNNNDINEELVAVASFSSRRKVHRKNQLYKSHELIRYCSKRHTSVIGGISKLCSYFIQTIQPDDIITVIDRDWGDGSGWHSLGFQTVSIMDPLPMVVLNKHTHHFGIRQHLIGAGITSTTTTNITTTTSTTNNATNQYVNQDRMGLSQTILDQLNTKDNYQDVIQCLQQHDLYPIYDTGVERLIKIITPHSIQNTTTQELWNESKPSYAKYYYSPNQGISILLQNCRSNHNTAY